jgi:O-antigen/teichoic acid export membrane protein
MDSQATAEIFRSVAVLYAAVCAVSVAFAGLAVRLLYGQQFAPATDLYYWLAPGVFCLGMINILAQHFAGRGFPLEAVLVWVPGVALNIAINVWLLPREGAYIAALASSITYFVVLLLHMRMFAGEVGGWDALRPRPREVVRFVRVALGRTAPEAAA